MTEQSGMSCRWWCWVVSALAGVLSAIMLMLVGDFNLLPAMFLGLLLFLILGFLLSSFLCSDARTSGGEYGRTDYRQGGVSSSASKTAGVAAAGAAAAGAAAYGASASTSGSSDAYASGDAAQGFGTIGSDANVDGGYTDTQSSTDTSYTSNDDDVSGLSASSSGDFGTSGTFGDATSVPSTDSAAAAAETGSSVASDELAAARARAEAKAASDAASAKARADLDAAGPGSGTLQSGASPTGATNDIGSSQGSGTSDSASTELGATSVAGSVAGAGAAASGAVAGSVGSGGTIGSKPIGLTAARGGQADDLKRIKGVGPKMETMLNGMGYYHYDQVSDWGTDEVAWVDDNLEGFKGRVTRDRWVPQAKMLASGADVTDAELEAIRDGGATTSARAGSSGAGTSAGTSVGSKPAGLSAARGGQADDLKRIKGVGPKMETMLNGMGYYHFDQVADWGAEEVAWVDDNLEGFKGRVTRDRWVPQAKMLASGSNVSDADLEAIRDGGTAQSSKAGAATAGGATSAGTKPAGLSAARNGKADDLKRIKGVGPKMETMLNGMGYYHFDQVGDWGSSEVAWVDDNLEGFKGRVTRDRWVPQARILASGKAVTDDVLEDIKSGKDVDLTDYDGDGISEASGEGTRPATLTGPRGGKADDLKMIKGVGPKMEKMCNSLGFYHFDQIAAWTPDEAAWVDANLEGFKGRVSRDNWISQAKTLASGGETAFSKRAEKDGLYD